VAVTVVVEDGTNVSNSNSYVSVADVTAFVTQEPMRDNGLTALYADAKAETAIRAAQYLDRRYRWYGLTENSSQSMQWPRTKNYNSQGQLIAPGTIPAELKLAQKILSLTLAPGIDSLDVAIDDTTPLKSLKIGPLEMEFATGKDSSVITTGTGTRYPEVEYILRSIGTLRDATDLMTRTSQGLY